MSTDFSEKLLKQEQELAKLIEQRDALLDDFDVKLKEIQAEYDLGNLTPEETVVRIQALGAELDQEYTTVQADFERLVSKFDETFGTKFA